MFCQTYKHFPNAKNIFTFSLNITTNILKVAQKIPVFVPTGAYAKICHKYLTFLLPIAMLKHYLQYMFDKICDRFRDFQPAEKLDNYYLNLAEKFKSLPNQFKRFLLDPAPDWPPGPPGDFSVGWAQNTLVQTDVD